MFQARNGIYPAACSEQKKGCVPFPPSYLYTSMMCESDITSGCMAVMPSVDHPTRDALRDREQQGVPSGAMTPGDRSPPIEEVMMQPNRGDTTNLSEEIQVTVTQHYLMVISA